MLPDIIINKIILNAMQLYWLPICNEIKTRNFVILISKKLWNNNYNEFIDYAEYLFPQYPSIVNFKNYKEFNYARFKWLENIFKKNYPKLEFVSHSLTIQI